MNKHITLAAAFAALCACSVEPVADRSEPSAETVILEAGFEGDETRTERQPDGKVYWLPGDEVGLFRGTGSNGGSRFTTNLAEPSATAQFQGKAVSGSGYYWALYPYNPQSYYDAQYGLVTELPAEQDGVAGSFADDLFISVGYSRSLSMTFYHLCGGVKFTVTEPDICKATLLAPGGEMLAGLVGIKMKSSRPYVYAYGEDYSPTIELYPEDGTFEAGEAYHFVTVPADLTGGFSIIFEKEDGRIAVKTVKKAVNIQRGHFATLPEADKGLEWSSDLLEYTPEEATVAAIGGSFSITVKSYGAYHVDAAEDWIHPISVKGDPRVGAVHTFLVDRNTGGERMGVVTVCNDSNCFPVMVSQTDGTGLKAIVHHSLGMRFTATWCGWCPFMNKAFYLAKDRLGSHFEVVNIHTASSTLPFSGASTLETQYKVGGFPTGIVDGRVEIGNDSDTDACANTVADAVWETEMNYPVVSSVGISSSLSGRTATVNAEVFTMVPDSYKLTVLLLENGVVQPQASNETGAYVNNYVHDNIARVAVTSISGEAFTAAANETRTFNYTVEVPDGYNLDNMTVLAYVQRPYGSQTVIRSANYGDCYIDNCRIVPLGASAGPEVE